METKDLKKEDTKPLTAEQQRRAKARANIATIKTIDKLEKEVIKLERNLSAKKEKIKELDKTLQ